MIALITGARGFIGRHLSRALQQQGMQVCGVGHGAWTETEREAWGVHYWLNGDVTKRNLDIAQSNVGKPNVIFHLAGGSSVGYSLLTPEEDFHRSVLATAELLEWARLAAPDTRLVLASSAAVYGAGHSQPIRESGPLAPYSPYGYHKHIAEEIFESYSKNFNLNVAIVRLFSVYGQELRKQLLWDICSRLKANEQQLILGGTGDETRDWLHISDAVRLIQHIAEYASHIGFIVNGGTGVPVTVRQIAEKVCLSWGAQTALNFSGINRLGDPQYLVANIDQLESLGFKSLMPWEAGISDYVRWFNQINVKVGS